MKIFLLIAGLIVLSAFAVQSQSHEHTFDSIQARKLGADKYGMKSYYFALLKTGSFITTDKAVRDSLFRGHMNNISRLADAGKLVVAGPFGKNDLNYRGLFILNTSSKTEADSMMLSDPAIASHLFEVELLPWYGSAALPVYLEVHKKIAAENP